MYDIAVITGIGGMCILTWTSCLQSWPGPGYFWGLNLATAKTYFGSVVWYHILDAATSYLVAVWLQWSRVGRSPNWNAVAIHPRVILVHAWCFSTSTLQGSPKDLICSQSIPHNATSIKEPVSQRTTMGPCHGIAVFLPNLMTIRKRASVGMLYRSLLSFWSEDSILSWALTWAGWCSIK